MSSRGGSSFNLPESSISGALENTNAQHGGHERKDTLCFCFVFLAFFVGRFKNGEDNETLMLHTSTI